MMEDSKMDATADNSGYAVHLRSPKPLRASHTRKTLSEMAHLRRKYYGK